MTIGRVLVFAIVFVAIMAAGVHISRLYLPRYDGPHTDKATGEFVY